MLLESSTNTDQVILVDEDDNPVGVGDKLRTHREGKLHRAFSIFVFDSSGHLLVQRRAPNKYHSGNLWSNTCCGHPRPGEETLAAAHRRLKEEMGFDCELEEAFSFVYEAPVGQGYTEHEYDHVYTGRFGGEPLPDSTELRNWRWASVNELARDLEQNPEQYTPWFALFLPRVLDKVRNELTDGTFVRST